MKTSVIAILGYVVSAATLLVVPKAFAGEQTEPVCAPVPTTIPYLKEVTAESLIDPSTKTYELEWAEIRVESQFPDGAKTSAAVSVHPTKRGFVPVLHCQKTSKAIGSALDAVLSGPLTINASDLSMIGWMDAEISVVEKPVDTAEISLVNRAPALENANPAVSFQFAAESKTVSLPILKAALAKEGDARLYKTSDERIELRASRTIVDDQKRMKIFTRHIYGAYPRKG